MSKHDDEYSLMQTMFVVNNCLSLVCCVVLNSLPVTFRRILTRLLDDALQIWRCWCRYWRV